MLLVPALGGLLVAPITLRLVHETRGQGVSEVMFAMETSGGRIRAIVAPAKAIATALTLGSGGSAGREGPVTQIGAGLGSMVGQLLRLSDDNVLLLAASGVAGGVSAMFNAPIADVFFALEVVLRDFNTAQHLTRVPSHPRHESGGQTAGTADAYTAVREC